MISALPLIALLLSAQEAPVVNMSGSVGMLWPPQKAVTIAYPRSWKNDLDVFACLLNRGDKYYDVYSWKPKQFDPFVKVKGNFPTIDSIGDKRKLRAIEIPEMSEDSTTVTYNLTHADGVTTQSVGVCWRSTARYSEELPDYRMTVSLKWDADAEVCRYKVKATVRRQFSTYYPFPKQFMLDTASTWQYSAQPSFLHDISVDFYDKDGFFVGNNTFDVFVNGSIQSGWFSGPNAPFICKKARSFSALGKEKEAEE